MTPRFTPRPSLAPLLITVVIILSLALGTGLAVSFNKHHRLSVEYRSVSQQLQQYQQTLADAQSRLAKLRATGSMPRQEVMKLLNPIGERLGQHITLLSVTASMPQRSVTLVLQASSLTELMDFSHRLQTIPAQVELQQHSGTDKTSGWGIVKATLTVKTTQEQQ